MSVVVTGGAGELGRAVITALADRGQAALPASRRTGVDLETGARVRSVLADADTVVHCASHPLRSRKVADRLADLALAPAPSGFLRAPDLAGPEVLRLDHAIAEVARHDNRVAPRVIALPAIAGVLRDFAAGGNLSGSDAELLGCPFSAWLARQPIAA